MTMRHLHILRIDFLSSYAHATALRKLTGYRSKTHHTFTFLNRLSPLSVQGRKMGELILRERTKHTVLLNYTLNRNSPTDCGVPIAVSGNNALLRLSTRTGAAPSKFTHDIFLIMEFPWTKFMDDAYA